MLIGWLSECGRRMQKTDRTIKSYYINHILPFFKNYDFETITNNDILKFTALLKEKNGIRTNEQIAPKTINTILHITEYLNSVSRNT